MIRHWLVASLVIGLLGGCSAEAAQLGAAPAESIESSPEAEPSLSQTPEPLESEDAGPLPCETEVQADISMVIDTQIAAFGAEDFELAYSYASPYFRASVSLEQFIQIIDGSYGPLIGSSNLVFSDCLVNEDGSVALINGKFIQANNEVYGLKYLMINPGDGWKVQGASNLSVVGEGA